jgi:hypothetical protein
MKKIIAFTLILIVVFSSVVCGSSLYKRYKKLVNKEKIGAIREYWTEDLTEETLVNRGDSIIVEKIIGVCVNENKDGKILNSNNGYISYKRVKGVKTGDTILTVCIYNPGNSYTDDIIDRIDYIIDRK